MQRGHDCVSCRAHLQRRERRGIKDRIAREGIERNDRLGCHRWVVERTHTRLAALQDELIVDAPPRSTAESLPPAWPDRFERW